MKLTFELKVSLRLRGEITHSTFQRSADIGDGVNLKSLGLKLGKVDGYEFKKTINLRDEMTLTCEPVLIYQKFYDTREDYDGETDTYSSVGDCRMFGYGPDELDRMREMSPQEWAKDCWEYRRIKWWKWEEKKAVIDRRVEEYPKEIERLLAQREERKKEVFDPKHREDAIERFEKEKQKLADLDWECVEEKKFETKATRGWEIE